MGAQTRSQTVRGAATLRGNAEARPPRHRDLSSGISPLWLCSSQALLWRPPGRPELEAVPLRRAVRGGALLSALSGIRAAWPSLRFQVPTTPTGQTHPAVAPELCCTATREGMFAARASKSVAGAAVTQTAAARSAVERRSIATETGLPAWMQRWQPGRNVAKVDCYWKTPVGSRNLECIL